MHVEAQTPVSVLHPVADSATAVRHIDFARIREFAAIAAQVLLLGVLIWRYNLESPAFMELSWLVFAGFVLNYFLPVRFRLFFFVLLSLACLVLVLGWVGSGWVVGVGLTLLGISHAPVAFRVRVGVLLALALLLGGMRAGWISTPWPVAIWPILGSMFMFRLMVYLYDLRYQTAPTTLAHSLAYFFMLPNVCFPLFPVVDYQSFVRNYYQGDRHQIHQVGVRWIFRGVVQLILYRIIYKNWSISLYEVADAGDVVHYGLWMFLLYLRLSGQFHIIVGMLHLFGFNLSETHHLYYLARSFTDFWRRINIYWKDFMMKLFFYPAYFRLKNRGPQAALILSTVIVFVLTWFLHALQWFWLRSNFLLSASDALFWTILAALVVVNSLWELTHGRQRLTPQGGVTWASALRIGLQTLATFTVICLLWSMWSNESLADWASLGHYLLVPPTPRGWLLIVATVLAIAGTATLVAKFPAGAPWRELSFVGEGALQCAVLGLLAVVSVTAINSRLGAFGSIVKDSRSAGLNKLDAIEFERGYYENLLSIDRFNSDLWNLYLRRPPEAVSIVDAGAAERTGDFQRYKLKPLVDVHYRGVPLRTNRWGMRDQDYEREPAPGTYRIAVIGASHAMGSGVAQEDTFESQLEVMLNQESGSNEPCRIEILNFAVDGYRPIQQLQVLKYALTFKPNAVWLFGYPAGRDRVVYELYKAISDKLELPDPYLRELRDRLSLGADTPGVNIEHALRPHANDILSWMYRTFASICKEHGIVPVCVLIPSNTGASISNEDLTNDLQFATQAGFKTLDLTNIYDGQPVKAVRISDWDYHPNPHAHRLIANRLREFLQAELPHIQN